ncbi:MAG: MFS transporter [Candidatus Helarchaeota archaeon]|nr:MFS transporter [Candidatus Helarchaeota archaeon]
MSKKQETLPKRSIIKGFWSFFIMVSLQVFSRSIFWINIVPLSNLFWPYQNFHAVEMGLIMTATSLTAAFSGIILGKIIDRGSRKITLTIISIIIGSTRIFISFAAEGLGYETWGYFLLFMTISSFFGGGNRPAHVSLSNDALSKDQRSQFFGILGIIWAIFQFLGFLVSAFAFQLGWWREFLRFTGAMTIISSIIFWIFTKEPKRGAQEEELSEVLKDEAIIYDFKMTRETMRKTMLSKTNVAALLEGIFSCILLGVFFALVVPYTQLPPHNISGVMISFLLITFGIAGAFFGQVFAKMSDKYAANNPPRRIKFIIFSLTVSLVTFGLFFFIPLPHLNPQQGFDVPLLFTFPSIWIFGIGIIIVFSVGGLYDVNQSPLLQNINLPEAQGQIVSWNQFVETLGTGLGPLLGGILLAINNQNFQITAIVTLSFGLPGILFWVMALRWYPEDRQIVKEILEERAKILKSKQQS